MRTYILRKLITCTLRREWQASSMYLALFLAQFRKSFL